MGVNEQAMGNVINPDDIVERFEQIHSVCKKMFMGPFDRLLRGIRMDNGMYRFI